MGIRFSSLAALLLSCVLAWGQSWNTFLDPSRAIDWTGAGFTIPNYITNCSTQPSLTANDPSAAAANTTAIQNALASCDATHNVVNIPAGTYYVAGWTYVKHADNSEGHAVVRGAGPMATTMNLTAAVSCLGITHGVCMISSSASYDGSASVAPPSGAQQCLWRAGYAKGTTTITLGSCGSAPAANRTLILDQQNDTADTGTIYICDDTTTNCTVDESGNTDGRVINGITYSQQQVVYVTGVVNNGDGTYSVAISPGVHFDNVRSSQSPGAWWPGFVQNDGLENMTLDSTSGGSGGAVALFNCYQCWVKNVRSLYAGRNHVALYYSSHDVIRDNYFYEAQSHHSDSYGIEFEESSDVLVENNIFQQVTAPIMFGQGAGYVIGYNYSVNDVYTGSVAWAMASFYAHNAGNSMGLWEGNNLFGIWTDDVWGSSALGTYFRNMLIGWQSSKSLSTFPVAVRANHRAFNIVGNVMGQPGYHDNYESYATSSGGGVNANRVNTSIYELGWTDNSGLGVCTGPPICDPLVRSTLMRWGNYDTVTGGTKWDSTEASPAAVPYVNANFTSGYFGTLAHTLPTSLYYSSTPSWWPAGKAWPPVGPDVSGGNLGTCSGTYAGAQGTVAAQCTGGTLNSAWAAHANSIPAQDCYLNTMSGPPDGTGGVLSFDANTCYYAAPGTPPAITTTSPLTSGTVGVAYSLQFTATGDTAGNCTGCTWSQTGAPSGLSMSSTGLLSGTPLAAGASTVSVTVSNSAGSAGPTGFGLTIGAGASTTVITGSFSGTIQ